MHGLTVSAGALSVGVNERKVVTWMGAYIHLFGHLCSEKTKDFI